MYNKENKGDVVMLELVIGLKGLMEAKDVKLNTLSRRSGVSNATISRILNKKTYPKFGTIYTLYRTLGVELQVELYKEEH